MKGFLYTVDWMSEPSCPRCKLLVSSCYFLIWWSICVYFSFARVVAGDIQSCESQCAFARQGVLRAVGRI